jgi:hypothetical protein
LQIKGVVAWHGNPEIDPKSGESEVVTTEWYTHEYISKVTNDKFNQRLPNPHARFYPDDGSLIPNELPNGYRASFDTTNTKQCINCKHYTNTGCGLFRDRERHIPSPVRDNWVCNKFEISTE